MKRPYAYFALVMAAVLLLTGCGSQTTNVPYVAQTVPDVVYYDDKGSNVVDLGPTVLNVGMVTAPSAPLNPAQATERDIISMNSLVFESVVELDDNMKPSPQLADRWSEDNGWWTFNLRNNVRFHDGSLLTSEDVVQSYYAFRDSTNENPYHFRVTLISSIETIDDFSFRVKGKVSGYMLLYALSFPVMQRSTISWSLPCGTGPYWYISYNGTTVQLDKNPLWWRQSAKIDTMYFTGFYDSTEALSAVNTGEIDTLATRSSSAALSRNLADRVSMDYTTLTYECLVPNTASMLFRDADTRKALLYAIDRSALAENAYLGMVSQTEVPVIPGSYLYEPQSAVFNYSPERALQLLYQAGWGDSDGDHILDRNIDGVLTPFEFTLMTYVEDTSNTRMYAADMIADQLALLGIRVTVNVVSKSSARTSMKKHEFDMVLCAFNLSEVPDLGQLYATGGGINYAGYSDEDMDGLIASARSQTDEEAFIGIFSQIQMKIVDDLPVLGLFFRKGTLMSTKPIGLLTGIRETNVLRGIEMVEID